MARQQARLYSILYALLLYCLSTNYVKGVFAMQMLGLRMEDSQELDYISKVTSQDQLYIFTTYTNDTNSKNEAESFWLSRYDTCREDDKPYILEKESTIKTDKAVIYRVKVKKGDKEKRSGWNHPMRVCLYPKEDERTEFTLVNMEDNSLRFGLAITLVVVTAFLSALFTGMNLGLLSLSMDHLELLRNYGSPKEKIYATNIIPIRKNSNLILCTIILGNTMVNIIQTFAFEDVFNNLRIVPSELKTVCDVVAPALVILLIGEILPQVLCTKFALAVGSYTRHIMVFMMVLTYPISWPVSKLLDKVLGPDPKQYYDKNKLAGVITQHTKQQRSQSKSNLNDGKGRQIHVDNRLLNILTQTIRNLPQKTAKEIMTKIEKVKMFSDETVISQELIKQLNENRHTRIPIYRGNDTNQIVGILNVKDLILVSTCVGLRLSVIIQLWYRSTLFRFVTINTPIAQLMTEMKHGIPIAIVVDFESHSKRYEVAGLLTLEDVMEEVVGEINDEKDFFDKYDTIQLTEQLHGRIIKSTKTAEEDDKAAMEEGRARSSRKRISKINTKQKTKDLEHPIPKSGGSVTQLRQKLSKERDEVTQTQTRKLLKRVQIQQTQHRRKKSSAETNEGTIMETGLE